MRMLPAGVLAILLSAISHQALVYGDIYTTGFEQANETLIRVEGGFSYQLVAQKSNYSIFLPEGKYAITGSTFDDGGGLALFTEEKITVGTADQRVDLVLKPANQWHAPAALILLFAALAYLLGRRPTASGAAPKSAENAPAQDIEEAHEMVEPIERGKESVDLDADAKKVLHILDSSEGRSTQKDVKSALGFSDSKLSLILGELESLGYVKKFKRGRGNIIKKLK
ncbi:MAG: hypothetical protein AB1324_02630 [Candidatus Micrarchaeota archaeon]